jgi:hypothetical protein
MNIKRKIPFLFTLLLLSSVARAQTHTFPAEDTNSNFTGTNPFPSNNNIIYVDAVKYPTIAAAVAAIPVGGATVYVPPGTYTLAETITVPSNSRLLCADGAIITQANAQNLSVFFSFAGSTNASIENCTIDGDRAGNTDGPGPILVGMYSSTNATVKGSRLRNGNAIGIYTGTGTGCTIQNNHFTNFWENAIQVGFTGSPEVPSNCTIKDNILTRQANIGGQNADGNVISGNKITGYAQAMHVSTSGTAVTWVSGTNFANLSPGMYMTTSAGGEILISAVGSSTSLTLALSSGTLTNVLAYAGEGDLLNLDSSSNNTISENVVNGGMGFGIVVHQSEGGSESSLHNTIVGNTVTKSGGACVSAFGTVGGPATTSGTAIVGNTISDCGQAGSAKGSGNQSGIELIGTLVDYTSIDGNNIYDDQGASPTTLYGISFDTGVPVNQFLGHNAITNTLTGTLGGGAAPAKLRGLIEGNPES